MHIAHHIENLPTAFAHGSVATIGNFDGVHLGHQRLIGETVECARASGLPSVAITFEPHPLRVMMGDAAPPLLMPLPRKLECIASLGVDLALVLPFTRETAATSPEDFVNAVLVEGLHTRTFFVGYDYAFGKGRRGNAELLAELGTALGPHKGFDVQQLAPVFAEGEIVSSTRIRDDIQSGNVDEATRLLGRPHSVEGVVAHGMKRGGSLLGFPTANLKIEENLLLPKIGIYAVLAELGNPEFGDSACGDPALEKQAGAPSGDCAFPQQSGKFLRGVANVGRNPTFGGVDLRVETHLLDFHADLYGVSLRVYFIHRLRDERKFADINALKEQIGRDAAQAREVLP